MVIKTQKKMKKLITVLLIGAAFISCEKEGCRCTGDFIIIGQNTTGQFLDVDCETGNRNDNTGETNLIFLGCID